MTFKLTPQVFTILRALVEERAGIHYSEGDLELFASKLSVRVAETGFSTALDYYYFLRYDDPKQAEFDALIEALVVNETYFFRELDQLSALCDDILPSLVARGNRPRVWCAAAATGEEPLTISMLLEARGIANEVDIVASDISDRALARAREGVYGARAFRATDDAMKARWFTRAGEHFAIAPELVSRIAWRRINILDEAAVAGLGIFDVILCRNILIYFAEATIRRIMTMLADRLRPDGYLLVGASESLLRFGTLFACEERKGAFLYTKGNR